jgi:hypothetical protein
MLHKLPSSSQLHRENPLSFAEADIRSDKINSSPGANAFNIAAKMGCSLYLNPFMSSTSLNLSLFDKKKFAKELPLTIEIKHLQLQFSFPVRNKNKTLTRLKSH